MKNIHFNVNCNVSLLSARLLHQFQKLGLGVWHMDDHVTAIFIIWISLRILWNCENSVEMLDIYQNSHII